MRFRGETVVINVGSSGIGLAAFGLILREKALGIMDTITPERPR